MGDIYYISAALLLIAALLTAGIFLRSTASIVQHYASRDGSPHLATGVRIVGLLLFGMGLSVGGLAGLVLIADPEEFQARIQSTAALLAAAYLLFAGAAMFLWGQRLTSSSRLLPEETSVRLVIGMAWLSGLMSLGVCLATFFEPVIVLAVLPTLALVLCLLFLIEIVIGWGRRGHRQLWALWQICLAVRSRRPLADELHFLSDYSWGAQRRRLIEMSDELQEGAEPEEVLIRPSFLSAMEGAQVATGLKSGRLPEALRDLLARRTALTNDLLASQDRFYAALQLCFTLLMLIAVQLYLMKRGTIAQFYSIFSNFDMEVPPLTKLVFSGPNGLSSYWYLGVPAMVLVTGVATVIATLPVAGSFPRMRERLSAFWPRICMPDMLRSLSFAVSARLPLEEALVPLIRRQFEAPLHSRLVRVQEAVREGSDCWGEMAIEKLLTPTEASLLQSAQRAGNLPWALAAIGRRCEQRWRFWLMFSLEFVQPILLLCVAILVAYFVVALFLPMVKLTNDLS